jgi:ribose 5-phosphate isomerase B
LQKSSNTKVKRIVIGADHAGVETKDRLVAWLKSSAGGSYRVEDIGTQGMDSVDYPDFAEKVGKTVAHGKADRGVLVCGTGIGMGIAANKVRGVRAAVVWDENSAGLASEHNGANVVCLSARFATLPVLKKILKKFLSTPFGEGRHARRVGKITALEKRWCR